MMRFAPCEEDPNVNIMLRSGIMTRDDKVKQPEESAWVRKAPTKKPEFDLEHAKETFMEPRKSFAKASILGSKDKLEPEMDPSMLTTYLDTCMKLLCDNKAMKGLQELITRCVGTTLGELCVVWKLSKHTTQTGREMRLIV